MSSLATKYARWDALDVSDSEPEGDSDDDTPEDDSDEDVFGCHLAAEEEEAAERAALRVDGTSAAQVQLEQLRRAERLGEEILSDRQQIVDYDRRRNQNREALAALRRMERDGDTPSKHWICLGETFVRRPHASARQLLEEDQARLDREIERCRDAVKQKTAQLCTLDPSMCATCPMPLLTATRVPTLAPPRVIDACVSRVSIGGTDLHRSMVDLTGMSVAEIAELNSPR